MSVNVADIFPGAKFYLFTDAKDVTVFDFRDLLTFSDREWAEVTAVRDDKVHFRYLTDPNDTNTYREILPKFIERALSEAQTQKIHEVLEAQERLTELVRDFTNSMTKQLFIQAQSAQVPEVLVSVSLQDFVDQISAEERTAKPKHHKRV